MESLGKRKRGDNDDNAGDRLSALPDPLLHEIISRLKARQMVRTCKLSRRWRHLWPKAPRLDIDQQHEFSATDTGYNYKKFGDFVHFLLQKVSIARLDELRLHVHAGFGSVDDNASAWIRRAIMSSALEPQRERLPSSGFWRLKTLHLSNLGDLDELFAEHIRSRCPSLEDLELMRCTCRFRAIASGSLKSLALKGWEGKGLLCEIASPTLRSLVFEGGGSGTNGTSPGSLFLVTAPALARLSLDISPYNFPVGVSFSEMASLAKASIHLKERETLAKRNYLRNHLFKTLRSVSNAANLELSSFDITACILLYAAAYNSLALCMHGFML
jgi:hypothetical protein